MRLLEVQQDKITLIHLYNVDEGAGTYQQTANSVEEMMKEFHTKSSIDFFKVNSKEDAIKVANNFVTFLKNTSFYADEESWHEGLDSTFNKFIKDVNALPYVTLVITYNDPLMDEVCVICDQTGMSPHMFRKKMENIINI